MRVTLSFPHACLNPNAKKKHWAARMPHKNASKAEAITAARRTGIKLPAKETLIILVAYVPNARLDRDNVLAMCKSMLDGLAQGWGINDNYFIPVLHKVNATKKTARVEVVIADQAMQEAYRALIANITKS